MTTTSKVYSIIDALRTRILAGEFGSDGRLPSFRKLVIEYETSQETMNKAMQALQAEGLLLSSGAKGVFVNKHRLRIPGMVSGFYDDVLKKEPNPIGVNLTDPKIINPSPEIIKKMNLSKKELVLRRIRKQGAGGLIFRVVEEYFPMSFINNDMLEKIYKDPHYNILSNIKEYFGKTSHHAHEELIARFPTAEEQTILNIVRTNPVIDTQRTHFTADKKTVITYNHKILNANLFLLTFDYPVSYWDK